MQDAQSLAEPPAGPQESQLHANARSGGSTGAAAVSARAPGLGDYLRVGALLALYCGLLSWLSARGAGREASVDALVAPMAALVSLVALTWLLMVVLRNYASMRDARAATYYLSYKADPPPDWIERPARAFNNLMQLPTLFYVACLIMMVRGRCDEAQLWIAWLYVATRALHAVVYIGWNPLPYRFASWVASSMALGVLWWRLVSLG